MEHCPKRRQLHAQIGLIADLKTPRLEESTRLRKARAARCCGSFCFFHHDLFHLLLTYDLLLHTRRPRRTARQHLHLQSQRRLNEIGMECHNCTSQSSSYLHEKFNFRLGSLEGDKSIHNMGVSSAVPYTLSTTIHTGLYRVPIRHILSVQ